MPNNMVEFYIDTPRISGRPIPLKSYEITYDLLSGCATWDAEIDPANQECDGFVRSEIRILLDKNFLIRGFVDRVEMSAEKDGYSQRISGRDLSSVLIDNYILKYKPYSSGHVPDILADVWNNSNRLNQVEWLGLFGSGQGNGRQALSPPLRLPALNFIYTPEAQKALFVKINQNQGIRTTQGQTLHDFFSTLLNQYGCIYYCEPGTNNIIVTTYNTDGNSYHPDGTIDKAVNYLDYSQVEHRSFSRNYQDYYPFIRLTGQSDGDIQSEGSSGSTDIAGNRIPAAIVYKTEILSLKEMNNQVISDTNLSSEIVKNNFAKFYVQDLTASCSYVWNYNSYKLLLSKRMSQNREIGNLRYSVYGHYDMNGRPYYPNRTYKIEDNLMRVRGNFLLMRISMRGSKSGGLRTDLEFMPVLNSNPAKLQVGVGS